MNHVSSARIKIRIHPLFILLLVASAVIGMLGEAVIVFSIVIIHEWSHAITAKLLGYRVREVELLPYGGIAKIEHSSIAWSPLAESTIAIAGPLSNVLLVALASSFHQVGLLSVYLTGFFIKSNLMIAFFNLLPALPLDGGRILRASLATRGGYVHATEVATRMAFLLSFIFVLLGVGALWIGLIHVGLIILALFLLLSAWQLHRQAPVDLIRFLDAKRRERRSPLPVRCIAASPTSTLREVIRRLSPEAVHLIYVMDSHQRLRSTLTEAQLLDAVFDGGGMDQPISAIV